MLTLHRLQERCFPGATSSSSRSCVCSTTCMLCQVGSVTLALLRLHTLGMLPASSACGLCTVIFHHL